MTRSWLTLMAALVVLIASLAASALLGLRGAAHSLPYLLANIFGGSAGLFLLLITTGLAVAALLVVIVTAVLSLADDKSRSTTIASGQATVAAAATDAPQRDAGDRDNDGRWIQLVEGCVQILDELDKSKEDFDTPRQQLAGHVVLRLEEVLERSGVEVITDEPSFDRARHKPVSGSRPPVGGAAISETLSPGFAVGHRILRRAWVRVE